MVRKHGFIDVDKMLDNIGVDTTSLEKIIRSPLIKSIYGVFDYDDVVLLKFNYNNDIYYFKYKVSSQPYNELIVNELSRDFGIPVVEYDLAVLGDKEGVISKNFINDGSSYIIGDELLSNYGLNGFEKNYNSLDSIWDALEYRYNDYPNKREIIERLMNRIVSIFIFDIILCQSDRHTGNWAIEESADFIDIVPIYDNEEILNKDVKGPKVSLIVEDDFNLYNNLKSFLKISSEDFCNLIREKLFIISAENLKLVFKRVEEKTGFPMAESLKEQYLKKFSSHKYHLEQILNNYDRKGNDEYYERKNR